MTGGDTTRPRASAVPTTESGTVIWHREHLRVADQPAVATAIARADTVLPVFVFDPAFYGDDGLACDSRVRFLHECLRSLDTRYRQAMGAGLTYAHGDPVAVLDRFREAGWDIVAPATPTGRYGAERDRRAREQAGVRFVDGDGLVRGVENTRADWQSAIETYLEADPYPWRPDAAEIATVETDITPEWIESHYAIEPSKTRVPTGGIDAARDQLEAFVDRIEVYPSNISAPQDAREGASGLSPYLRFGCLSVRQVYQYVRDHAPACRGREMFCSRLVWNKHYEQKLEDWPGWLDQAVNPVLEGFNTDRYDPELVQAWKAGQTGYPMVDAAMRCLRETGWLNFRMRAMCASVYFHILQQPWRIGADYFHHHLIDSEASINYTQWQSQCGLIGKPTLRLYNPRKQVRDQDPEGIFIRRWVPELASLPDEHLDRPEATPLHVQAEVGVEIGEDYPRPVVDYDSARQTFLQRFEAALPAAADALGRTEIADRASLSGGREAAKAIAADHGTDDDRSRQTQLGGFGG